MTPDNYRYIDMKGGGEHAYVKSVEQRLFIDDFLNEMETWRSRWYMYINNTLNVSFLANDSMMIIINPL